MNHHNLGFLFLFLFFHVLFVFASTSTIEHENENECSKQLLGNDKVKFHTHCCTEDHQEPERKQIEYGVNDNDDDDNYDYKSNEYFYFGNKSENSELTSSDLGTETVAERNIIISQLLEYPCIAASLACVYVAFLVYLFCVFYFIFIQNK